MVKWCPRHAILVVILTLTTGDLFGIHCFDDDLFSGGDGGSGLGAELDSIKAKRKHNMDLFEEILAKKEIKEVIYTRQDYKFERATIIPTKKYTKRVSSEFILEDMKNKKLFEKARKGDHIMKVLESLSYDDDYADDQEVTMYKEVFSHEKTSTTTTPKPKEKRKTIKTTIAEGVTNVMTGNTVMYASYDADDEQSDDSDSGPKQITSQEAAPCEYLIDVLSNNQTVFRRIYPTPRPVQLNTTSSENAKEDLRRPFNLSQANTTKRTRRRRSRTTTQYKVLRTEKSRHKFHKLKKKYEHLIIGKLPNTTVNNEKDCLEKEIIHIFTIENMKRYITILVHYYKHYRSHFNDVVNLVRTVSIFDIETDNIDFHCTGPSPSSTQNSLDGQFHHMERGIECTTHLSTRSKVTYRVPPTLPSIQGNVFVNNKHLTEKFDLAALNNLFNNEKRIITDDDRTKYETINNNLKHIIHCLKLNLNLNKYNYLNETNVQDVVDIIWKNRVKYDDSDYSSEYEDLYEMMKTIDYYSVSSQYRDQYAYYMNQPSGIQDEEPYTRNPENQRVIKEALRNISRIRRERNEFDRGIIEGQMLHRCHYCGKNYSSAEHGRYQKHVYNHMLQELDGPDYEKGVYVKERECWTKMLAHMTKVTIPTDPTIDIFPYYEGLNSNEFYYEFETNNFTTRTFDELVQAKRKKDAKIAVRREDFEAKQRRAEADQDAKDMRKYMNRKDLVTFSDESLPGVIKRFVNRFVNNSDLLKNRTDMRRFNLDPADEEKTTKGTTRRNQLLGQFEDEKELQEEFRLNELKLAAHELLKQKDWRSQLSMHLTTTTDVEVERREEKLKKMKKVQRKRYQQKLLKEKKQREMQQIWHQHNMNADKWVFKTNVWTTLVPQ